MKYKVTGHKQVIYDFIDVEFEDNGDEIELQAREKLRENFDNVESFDIIKINNLEAIK